MINLNQNERPTSLQVSRLWNIPAGDFIVQKGNTPILLKNITEDSVTLEILLMDSNDYVSTVIYPGWNPELVIGIKSVPADTLQAGN